MDKQKYDSKFLEMGSSQMKTALRKEPAKAFAGVLRYQNACFIYMYLR